ncbi:MAG: CinA family protein [Pseudomonadales bacterium]
MSLTTFAAPAAVLLKSRNESVAIAESSTGGLISASLLAVPGASAYFLGGAVIYTRESRRIFMDLPMEKLKGVKPLTEEIARIFAESIRETMGSTWGVAELGVAGPSGTPYSDEVGVSVIAIAGPIVRSEKIETGHNERERNMHQFSERALALLEATLMEAENEKTGRGE